MKKLERLELVAGAPWPMKAWLALLLVLGLPGAQAAGDLKAGVGRIVITPERDQWMAGYAARTNASEGKIHELYAKALAFEDDTGKRFVLVTTDLLGLPRTIAQQVADGARQRFGLAREQVALTFSHTHCGPVIGGDRLFDMYGLDADQQKRVSEYTAVLPGKLLQVIGESLESLEPCRVEWGIGRAGFAMNRRTYTTNGMGGGSNPIGPVDHDVPVLKVVRANGGIKAVVHGYACHNTTLSFQKFCGDYAGFSEAYLEQRLPGAVALFVAGCGADANPYPRGTLEMAQQYGEELGVAVLTVLRQKLPEIRGPIRAGFVEIPLALSAPPARLEVEKQVSSKNVYEQRRARRLLQTMDETGGLPSAYPYPVQFWRFGDTLQMPILGGEVVVDYSLRLKSEFGRERTWVVGYANDFMAYIPSLRVLREGGYEGGDAMVYFGMHGPWAPSVERDIIKAVHDLADRTAAP